MLPYANLSYYILALAWAAGALLLVLAGRGWRSWILLASVAMVAVHSAAARNQVAGLHVGDAWVVLGYAAFQWLIARGWLRARSAGRQHLFAPTIALALLPLVLVKLAPHLAPTSRIGFLGVSYVSFRALDVVIGIRDGLIRALDTRTYFSFVLFFPTISAGPIDRYRRFAKDYDRRRTGPEAVRDFDLGVHRVFNGLALKFVAAALTRAYWLEPAAAAHGIGGILSYMYAYSFYLYFDFAGYSELAIGVSYWLGIRTPENFRRPFLSRNIVDFWNRWHISLSTWFRDHIYMRIVLAATRRKWFASRNTGSYVAFLVAFVLMGLWHGVEWQYFWYGLYHAGMLIGHSMFSRWARDAAFLRSRAWEWTAIFITFNFVCFGFLLFSGRLQ